MKNKTADKFFLLLVFIILTGLGFGIRYLLRLTETWDFTLALSNWYETIKQEGWKSIIEQLSSYSPPYYYLLYVVHRVFPALSNVEAIKLVPILTDFINALLGMGIVYTITKSQIASLLCYASLFFAPTIFINSAYWGQSDSLYTCGILASLWFMLKKKSALSIFAFGLAYSVKLQAIFLAPFILALVLTGYFSWKNTLAFPLAVFLSYVPALLTGYPIQNLLGVYGTQANTFEYMTMNAASAYAWFANAVYVTVAPAGVLFAAGICLIYVVLIFYRKKTILESRDLILLAALSSVMVPFFLPAMHERYFYLLDVISILLLFCYPKLFYIAIITQLTSFFSYQPYLFSKELIPLSILSLGNLFILVVLSREMILRFYPLDTIQIPESDPVA